MRNDFLQQTNSDKQLACDDIMWRQWKCELTLLELLLSVLLCSSYTTKHSRKFVMISSPTRFWFGGAFFFLDCALIFCAMYKLTLVALAASISPTGRGRKYLLIFSAASIKQSGTGCGFGDVKLTVQEHGRVVILRRVFSGIQRLRNRQNNNNKDCEIILPRS